MRTVFLLLLLANLAFFAWSWQSSPADAAGARADPVREVAPDKLRIVPPQ